jgi:hypothetical protein
VARQGIERVREQSLIFAGVCARRMAFSDPLFVAGTLNRIARSQTRTTLRLSRPARTSPGWLPVCHWRDRFTEIPASTSWSALPQAGGEIRAEAGTIASAGGPDGNGLAQHIPACRVQA